MEATGPACVPLILVTCQFLQHIIDFISSNQLVHCTDMYVYLPDRLHIYLLD